MTRNDFRDSEARLGLFLILPAVFLVILVVILPIISGIQISFTSQRVVGSDFEMVGLKNYLDLFENLFSKKDQVISNRTYKISEGNLNKVYYKCLRSLKKRKIIKQ